MLYRLIIGNWASFAEPVQFDMFPNMKRENFPNHVYHDSGTIPVLKSCALYGANGSGKSNFIGALKFIKEFATDFDLDVNANWLTSVFNANRFKLPKMPNDVPMSFLIEFGGKLDTYLYTIEINETGVLSEEALYISGKGQSPNKLIFRRNANEVSFAQDIASEEMTRVFNRQLTSNPSQSVMSIIGKLHLVEDNHINDAYNWLNDQLVIIDVDHKIPWLVDQLRHQSDVFKFVKEVFSNIGLGIKDLSIKNESFEDWLKHADAEDKSAITNFLESVPQNEDGSKSFSKMNRHFPLLTITEEDGVRTVSELLFHQFGKNGFIGTMDCSAQSIGTLRLLTLIPAFYYAIYNNKTIVIDEIDNSIHPILIKGIIKFFGDSTSNGQLIFTTHETALLNQQELLRPDEVWMIEKTDGTSKMYSLNDFKIHKTLSIENGYLDGRFGAIPFLGTIDLLKNISKSTNSSDDES